MSVLIYKFSGQSVPEDVLDKCLLSSTAIAIALAVMQKDKTPYVAVVRMDLSKSSNQKVGVQKFIEKYKGQDVAMFFDSPAEGLAPEQKQPHTLLVNADDKPSLVAFVTGVENPEDEMKDYLVPKIKKIFNESKMDLDTLTTTLLEDKLVAREISGIGSGEGAITMVAANDKLIQFAPEGTGKDYDWGWVAGDIDGEEAVNGKQPEQTSSVEDDMASLLSGDEASAPDKKVESKPDKDQTHKTDAKPGPLNQPDTTKPEFVEETAPVGLRDKDLYDWIIARVAKPPKDFKALYKQGKLKLLVPKSKTIKDLKDLGTALPKDAGKDTTTKHVPTPPVLTADQRKAIEEGFLKGRIVTLVGKDDKDMMDPARLAEMEDKLPDFALQLGLPSIAVAYGWDYDALIKLGKTSVEGLACLAAWSLFYNATGNKAEAEEAEEVAEPVAAVGGARRPTPSFSRNRR